MPSTLKHQWVFIGQVLGGRLQKISKKQTLEPLLCLLVHQNWASVPKRRPVVPSRQKRVFLHKLASVPELGPRHDTSAETCFSCRFARFLEPSIPVVPSRQKRLFFTKLRYIRLFLHNLASVPKHVSRQGTSARRCLVIACVFGSGTLSIEAEPRRSSLSFAFP